MTARAVLLLLFMAASVSAPARAAEVSLEPAFPRLIFDRPVDLQDPRDGSTRFFVVEQAGVIRVFPRDRNTASSKVFLDLRDRVDSNQAEQGLLGLAFHPRYKENGFFYVDYTAGNPLRTVIARYRVDSADPERADPSSAVVLLEIAQPYSNHNGGQVSFGPDGFLYVAMGDGGAAGDPHGHGQDRRTLLGDILRIDVDRPSGGLHYGIPADNPFKGNNEGFREEIYAWGQRNPWRFSWDEKGRMWAADVGQHKYEEINLIESGKNYGWNKMEGAHCFAPPFGCDRGGLSLPVAEYPHKEGRSVTGGFVYRGGGVPALSGDYVFADFVTGKVWALRERPSGKFERRLVLESGKLISSFGTDAENELYVCAFDGLLYRIGPA